jgi:WD40 repeat protein
MNCRQCGAPLTDDPSGARCLRCSFERALAAGRGRAGEADENPPGSASDLYEFLHELGRGAMGVVWLARERALDRLVALKVAAPGANPAWSARLLREGKAVASLRHPHIVAVHAMGGEGSSAFLAMEFVEAGGLDDRLREGPLSYGDAAAIAAKVAGALSYAHGAGLLHRDIKPSNILMDEKGEPHLADFGLVSALSGSGDLTMPGQVAGTPSYLAPEILGGSDRASPASDVYGLGAVLYFCLTGRAPFVGESAGAILAQLPGVEPPPPHLLMPGIPRDLETICLKCLEKDPHKRYATAALLQHDLEAYLEGRPIAARPIGWGGRLVRAGRRHPAFAISIAATILCLLALAIGGPLMAYRLERAQASAQERLRDALLARSRATRLAAQIGQRQDALAAAEEAARIRPGLDARDEAIAALARPEIVLVRSWAYQRDSEGVIAFDPDNDRYAIEERSGKVDLRRLSDNGLIREWTGPGERLWTYPSFSADGHKAVARDESGEEIVWSEDRTDPSLVIGNRPYVLTGRFMGYGQPDAISPDGRMMASALPDAGVAIESTEDGHELRRIPTDTVATHVMFSRDGRMVAVGRGLLSREGRVVAFVHVVDVATGGEISRLQVDRGFQHLAWSPDGARILVTGERIELYRASDGVRLRSLNDPLAARGFFGPLGATLISSTTGGNMTLWDLGAARPLMSGPLGSRVEIAVNRGGDLIAKSIGSDMSQLVRLEMSPVTRTWPSSAAEDGDNVLSIAVSTIDFSPDGKWLATAVWGAVQLRDGQGSLVASLRLGTISNYCSVRFSGDGRSLIAGTSEEGLVRVPIVFQDDSHAELGSPETIDSEKPEFVTDISRDGRHAIATSMFNGVVRIVPLDGSKAVVSWKLAGAAGAAFLNDDRSVLANSLDSQGGAKIEVRDAATGTHVERVLPFPYGAHVNVSRDGNLVVLGTGGEGTVLLNARDWSQGPGLPYKIQGRGTQCAISPDGRMLAFCEGTQCWLVNAADGSVLAHLEGAQGGTYVPGLEFSPDGNQLALWWETGQLTMWDLVRLRSELNLRGLDWP